MANLWLTVEVAPGAEIGVTCDEAVALAERTGLSIWFRFNGVKCLARPGDNPRGLEADLVKEMAKERDYRIASDQGETQNVELRERAL